jgi:hypothetical protein
MRAGLLKLARYLHFFGLEGVLRILTAIAARLIALHYDGEREAWSRIIIVTLQRQVYEAVNA